MSILTDQQLIARISRQREKAVDAGGNLCVFVLGRQCEALVKLNRWPSFLQPRGLWKAEAQKLLSQHAEL